MTPITNRMLFKGTAPDPLTFNTTRVKLTPCLEQWVKSIKMYRSLMKGTLPIHVHLICASLFEFLISCISSNMEASVFNFIFTATLQRPKMGLCDYDLDLLQNVVFEACHHMIWVSNTITLFFLELAGESDKAEKKPVQPPTSRKCLNKQEGAFILPKSSLLINPLLFSHGQKCKIMKGAIVGLIQNRF